MAGLLSRMKPPVNKTGQKFGKLTALEWVRVTSGTRPRGAWKCKCECGVIVTVLTESLSSGHCRSCGCLKIIETIQRQTKHGYSRQSNKRPTYITWAGMIGRCYRPGNASYPSYGKKGVFVCDKWLNFHGFLEDMGDRPEGLTLDRINPWGNYEKSNCRWATRQQQVQNTRKNSLRQNPPQVTVSIHPPLQKSTELGTLAECEVVVPSLTQDRHGHRTVWRRCCCAQSDRA